MTDDGIEKSQHNAPENKKWTEVDGHVFDVEIQTILQAKISINAELAQEKMFLS